MVMSVRFRLLQPPIQPNPTPQAGWTVRMGEGQAQFPLKKLQMPQK